jgi:hypothetical protein
MLKKDINTSKGHHNLQEGVEPTKWKTCLEKNTSTMEFTTTMNNKMKKMFKNNHNGNCNNDKQLNDSKEDIERK